jgi:hypothetical protein
MKVILNEFSETKAALGVRVPDGCLEWRFREPVRKIVPLTSPKIVIVVSTYNEQRAA